MSHQYGPIGVQAFPEAVGSQNIAPLPLSASKQVELLERLKQLRAWQQRQQADLLRQQQEQLLRLKSEQQTVIREGAQDSDSTRAVVEVQGDGQVREKEEGDFDRRYCRPESPCSVSDSRDVTEPTLVNKVEYRDDVNDREELFDSQDCINQGELGTASDHEESTNFSRPLAQTSREVFRDADPTNKERPVQPVVGDFEQFLEQQLELDKSFSPGAPPNDQQVSNRQPKKFSFLRRGEGIARFGMKKIKLKPKKSPKKSDKSLPSSSSHKSPPKSSKPLTSSNDHHHTSASLDPCTVGQPPLLQNEKQPKVRKVARGWSEDGLVSSTKSLQLSYPRESTPSMFRCGSEESFIIRRDARVKREEEELREFELLEMATVEDTPTCHAPSVPFAPTEGLPLQMRVTDDGNPFSYDVDSNLRLLAYKDNRTTPTGTLQAPPREDAPDVISHLQWQHPAPEVTSEDCNNDGDDLDETLTGPSLVEEVDFNDEEEWHSFSQGSPVAQVRYGQDFVDSVAPNGSMLSVEVGASWSSPIRREQLNEQGLPIFQSPLPLATMSSVATTTNPETVGQQQLHPFASKHSVSHESSVSASGNQSAPQFQNFSKANPGTAISAHSEAKRTTPSSVGHDTMNAPSLLSIPLTQLPPPSALVAKLFPALRKDKRPQDLTAVNSKPSSKSAHVLSPHVDKTPSPTSSAGGDSGKGSLAAGSSATSVMNEELRRKLCLLETEIERFKSENATIEKLRKEKEEGLIHLKKEIAEFERQKEEEMTRFEEYKKEEMRKLKKERKMFETYQQQARTARDRKDKEDIIALRNELQELHEDLRQRESRWGATQSRLRLRIQSLEKENQELRSDLKMMEQTRLQLWQKQMEQEMEQAKKKNDHYSVTPDLELSEDQGVSDGYQSDGEGSDLSTRAEEIAEQVLADEQVDGIERQRRRRIPSGELKDHFPSDGSEHTSTSGVEEETHIRKKVQTSSADDLRKKATSKRVCFSTSPKRKPKPLSSPSKNVVLSAKQQRASPRRKSKAPLSPLKSTGEGGRAKQERVRNHSDETTESSQEDGSRVILFPNGTRKIISPDGKSTSVYFFNGDVKHVRPDQTVVYFYAESKTTHTTYSDGMEVFNFPNGQCEKHFPNGTKEITFPDKTLKYVYPSGEEETHFPDGTLQKVLPDGDMTLFYANGQKEIYTTEFKRREYPDGTVKTVYPDGRQETRYSSGRVRVKDKEGKTLFDKLPDT